MDNGLEKEADVMGNTALQTNTASLALLLNSLFSVTIYKYTQIRLLIFGSQTLSLTDITTFSEPVFLLGWYNKST